MTDLPEPTAGAKMMYLIRRKGGVTRDQLVAHWFAHHMPGVIEAQARAASRGRPHARRYLVTLFDPPAEEPARWDGVAQLWWDRPLPGTGPFGDPPRDSFQERAEPYHQWATLEYVIVDGAQHLPVVPLTLNQPFPNSRAGFHKVTCLVAAREGVDYEAFYRQWLTEHALQVQAALREAGGFRYVVSLSLDPGAAPYAGMAELYFRSADGWARLYAVLEPDAVTKSVDQERTLIFAGTTEFIGIP